MNVNQYIVTNDYINTATHLLCSILSRSKIIITITTITILIAVIGSLATKASKVDAPWAVLSVPSPPSSMDEDDSNFTWIRNEDGEIMRIPMDLAPKTPAPLFDAVEDVRFELFTPNNPTEPILLVLNNPKSVKQSHFNPKYPTRILVHGWNSEGLLTPRFAEAYLVKGKYKVNFIAVNWQKGADTINYLAARWRVPEVGKHLANFINFLADKHKLKLDDVTIVGHSLGAHVSGIAGKFIKDGKVGKIVGLDPAKPLFKYDDINGRLFALDANYVEVVHTCAGLLGMKDPIGMASFFPNGGTHQPGCSKWDAGVCSHGRSYEYFLESLERPRFLAFQCQSYEELRNNNCTVIDELVQMGGEPGNKKSEGIYYLETNPSPLYSQGEPGVIGTLLKNTHVNDLSLEFVDVVKGKLKKYEDNQIQAGKD